VFNFILSILVFGAVLFARGNAVEPLTIGMMKPLPEQSRTLEPGDQIVAMNGQEIVDFEGFYAVTAALPIGGTIEYSVLRNGGMRVIEGPYPFPPLIDGLQAGSAAMDVGLSVGDVITGIDGTAITAFSELQTRVAASEGTALLLDVWRAGEEMQFALTPRKVDLPKAEGGFETRWLIGMTGGLAFVPATETPGVFEALSYGANQTLFIAESSLSGLYHMITGAISSCNLRGPIGIAETSGAAASQGLTSFIWFIAVLSTAVGLLNLFPIPVLDGGHLVFHAYEAITGKPPSDKALRVLMGIGLTLMLSLMVFALTNDLFCP
jgi:regulator of sigma E protease